VVVLESSEVGVWEYHVQGEWVGGQVNRVCGGGMQAGLYPLQ
jgi:hypothetical protein